MAIRDDIVAHHASGTLLELLVASIRIEPHQEVAAELRAELIALHNSRTIDVLEPARTIAGSGIGQHDFFLVQHVYVDIIPQLEAEVPTMLAAVKALVARAGNDMASGLPNGAFRAWMEHSTRAIELLAIVDIENGEEAAAIFLALQALAKSDTPEALDRALNYLNGTALPAQLAAAKAIGIFDLPDDDARDRAISALAAVVPTTTDDNLRGHLISAAAEMTMRAPDLESHAVSLIEAASPEVGDTAIHHSSSALSYHAKDLTGPVVAVLAIIAQKVKPENKGTLDQLDHAGWALVNADRRDEALALIGPILSANPKLVTLEAFDSFSHALLALPADQLSEVVVQWLLSLDYQLGEAARGLVGDHHGDAPLVLEFDAASLNLPVAKVHGRYPTTSRSYWDLVEHPEHTEAYRKQATEGSIFYPMLALWAAARGSQHVVDEIAAFQAAELEHCTFQTWFPDEDSEANLYLGHDNHGAALTGILVQAGTPDTLDFVLNEVAASPYYDALSVITLGHWPLLLTACRHHRLPIPPTVWRALLPAIKRPSTTPPALDAPTALDAAPQRPRASATSSQTGDHRLLAQSN